MQNIINYNLHKRNNIAPNLNEGNNSNEIFINLKYAGQNCNSLEDNIRPKVVYNSAKLSQYFNMKDSVPQKYKSDLVCKCTCPQIACNESYIGETERRVEERIIDHNKCDKKSHIYKHSGGNSHSYVLLDNFQIVGRNYGNR